MRVLGIDTSTRRGSLALIEDGRVIASAEHDRPNAHAEEMLPLLTRMMAEHGIDRRSIERIGVSVGPGAFTGIRVGIALAHGIALGLGRPVFGVGSLEAMAEAVPAERPGLRCALLDARRGEVFVAVYEPDGRERAAPRAIARERALGEIEALAPLPRVVIGEVVDELGGSRELFRSPQTELPHAIHVAQIAARRSDDRAGAEPCYVRDAGAVLPKLPPSPFVDLG